jgi:RNA polymerase sigma factor (TIGR02999 family)
MNADNPHTDSTALQDALARIEGGDATARDDLFALLYAELHRLAESHLRRGGRDLTLGTTTLLHEAYVDLNRSQAAVFPDRLRFLKYASRAMRGLVIDYARHRRAQKRGGEFTFTSLDDVDNQIQSEAGTLERIGLALEELAGIDRSLAELVDLKFFCGFSFAEIAAIRGSSERTEQREWAKARVLLHRALSAADQGPLDE